MKFEKKTQPLVSKKEFLRRLLRSIVIAFILVTVSLLIGTAGYHYFGELHWLDSFLNSSMILTGMGPVDKLNSDAGKLFAAFYSLFSGIAFLTTISVILAPILHRGLHRFHLGDGE